jgi:CBS domain-containing protein
MAQSVRDVMTRNPLVRGSDTILMEAATLMRDADVGDVLVEHDGQLCGLVTDRDIVVRAVAKGADPKTSCLGDICSHDLVTLSPKSSIRDAVELMRDRAVRRVPVVDNGTAVGIVTLGDLAMERDPDSVLADISEAQPSN